MQQNFELDNVDPNALTTALSAVALRLRTLIIEEVGEHPEQYADLLPGTVVKADPAIDAMVEIVRNIEEGKDIRASYDKIARLTHNQDSRAEIFGSLSQTHDYGRYVSFLQARRRVETILLAIAEKATMSPGDALAMLAYLGENIAKIEKKTAGNSVSGKDIAALLGKIDYLVNVQQQTMHEQMAHTTPQNREIMRRVATKLLKAAKPAAAS